MKTQYLLFVISMFLVTGNIYAQDMQGAVKTVKAQQNQALNVSKQDNILLLTINDLPRNATSVAVLNTINKALDKAENDSSIGAIVITGTGHVFSSGAGGESIQGVQANDKTQAQLAYETFRRMERFPKVIIAAVNGISAGGGNELALACDIRIASESAKFRQHELQAGLIPGFGGTQRLVRLIGRSNAMQLMLTGDYIDAQQAKQIGLVANVVADGDIVTQAVALGKRLDASLDKKALAVFKVRMSHSLDEDYTTALKNDQLAFDQLAGDPHIHEAIKMFIERQKAKKN